MTFLGTNPCTSGKYTCEEGWAANWNISSSSKKLKVSKDLCLSERAVIKNRDAASGCGSAGLFCKFTTRELLNYNYNDFYLKLLATHCYQ